MRNYESTFIVRQDLTEADVNTIADTYVKVVKDSGGKLVHREYWGLRSLAYKINKAKKGHYFFLAFEADGTAVKEIERRVGISEDVVRNLTVRVETISSKPTVMMQQPANDE